MCLAQGPQHSDAGEAQTRGSSVSSQALYHWATALPLSYIYGHTKIIRHLCVTKQQVDNRALKIEKNIKYSCTIIYLWSSYENL